MSDILFWGVFAGYFVCWVLYFIHFETEGAFYFTAARRLLSWTLAVHFTTLVFLLGRGQAGLSFFYEFSVPLFIVALSFFMEWRYRAKFLLLFSLPIVLLVSLLIAAHLEHPAPPRGAQNAWLWLHLGLILAGLAGFVAAVSSAIMYLWQSAQLKSKNPGQNFLKLPSLDTLDKLHFRSLVWGVILFSLGIGAGVFWARDLRELGPLIRDPKVILSLLTCSMYWLIVSLRFTSLRRGQKIAVGTLLVFLLLFLTLASSYYAPSAFHGGV